MLGNDIVDLAEARKYCNWRRAGYLNKVFTPREQDWIQQADQPDEWVWLLWSAKESVYKLMRRQGRIERGYAPKKLALTQWEDRGQNPVDSVVTHAGQYCRVQSWRQGGYRHSIALAEEGAWAQLQPGVVEWTSGDWSQQQKQLRATLSTRLAEQYGGNSADYEVVKDEQAVPLLLVSGIPAHMPFSLSHHGRYGAFVWYEDRSVSHLVNHLHPQQLSTSI